MGNLQAQALASLSVESPTDRRAALHVHLRSNHYPPLPEAWVEFAERVLDAAQEAEPFIEDGLYQYWSPERLDDVVALGPEVEASGMRPRDHYLFVTPDGGKGITVGTAISILHLDAFVFAGVEQ